MGLTKQSAAVLILILAIITIIIIIAILCCHSCNKNNNKSTTSSNTITSLPQTLTNSGTYIVDADIPWNNSSGAAITVSGGADVTISFTSRGKITLNGVGPDYNVNDPNQTYNTLLSAIYVTSGSNVNIINASINNSAGYVNNSIGVIIENTNTAAVSSSRITNVTLGVMVIRSLNVRVVGNSFADNIGNYAANIGTRKGSGVVMEDSDNVVVDNNSFTNSTDYSAAGDFNSLSIYAGDQRNTNIVISNNKIENANLGIRISNGAGFRVIGNDVAVTLADNSIIPTTFCLRVATAGFTTTGLVVEDNNFYGKAFLASPVFITLTSGFIFRNNTVTSENSAFSIAQFGSRGGGFNGGFVEGNTFTGINTFPGLDGVDIESPAIVDGLPQSTGMRFVNNTVSTNLGGTPDYFPPAVLSENNQNIEISDNTISVVPSGDTTFGVWVFGSTNASIRNNTIAGATVGVGTDTRFADGGVNTGIEIHDNFISGGGVVFESTSCSFVTNNRITSACDGVSLDCSSDNNLIADNKLTCAEPIQNHGQNNSIVDNIINSDCHVCDSVKAASVARTKISKKPTHSLSKKEKERRIAISI